MQSIFDDLVTVNYNDDFFRNIKTIRKSQNLYDDLSDDPEEQACATQAEMNSKPKQYSTNPIINRPFEEANFIQAIAFPFNPKNWQASRYSNGSHGAWYGSIEFETCIYETIYYWKRFVQAAQFKKNIPEIIGERKVYKVRCKALLFDFRKKIVHYPKLIDPDNYTFSQQIAEYLQQQGHPGLLSQSARCDGNISAIFAEQVLSNPRDYCYLSYFLDTNTGNVRVERELGKKFLTIA